MASNKKDSNGSGGLLFVGFMFVGIAAGSYWNSVAIGTLAGMGAGFLAMAIYMAYASKKSQK
ncbi:hypothetical protein HYX70_04950 [Candidatus Saccharibacteria bacterium]|nr:hypothetical protein [Candidatus Saccharibacteria bacterium]